MTKQPTLVSISPNAGKLIESLRSAGYSNTAAVADLIDNALDAGANDVEIRVSNDEIVVADNGSGMDKATLTEAMKLGSVTERVSGDLGKYGMGMVTASISIGQRLEVTTRNNGVVHHGIQDLEQMKDIGFQMQYSQLEAAVLPETGTIVRVSKLDRLQYKKTETLEGRLRNELGRIFRHFILAGKTIRLNGKPIEAVDPLMENHKDTIIHSNENYEIAGGLISMKIALLPEFSEEKAKELGIITRNSGFYVVRNNREIVAAETFGLWFAQHRHSRIRIELMFDDRLDTEFGVDFTKHHLSVGQRILDFLREGAVKEVSYLRRVVERERKVSKADSVDHAESEEVIQAKSKLLVLPKPGKKQPDLPTGPSETPEPEAEGKEAGKSDPKKPRGSDPRVRIGEAHLGRLGEIFEAHLEGRVVVVEWNIDHPFYQRVVLVNKGDKNIITAMDYLVYSLGSAELQVRTPDAADAIDNLKSLASSNLRTLIS